MEITWWWDAQVLVFMENWVLKNFLRKEVLTKGWSNFHSFWISKQKGQLKVEQQTQMMEVLQKDVSLFFFLVSRFWSWMYCNLFGISCDLSFTLFFWTKSHFFAYLYLYIHIHRVKDDAGCNFFSVLFIHTCNIHDPKNQWLICRVSTTPIHFSSKKSTLENNLHFWPSLVFLGVFPNISPGDWRVEPRNRKLVWNFGPENPFWDVPPRSSLKKC